jgi:hypothetical protein
MAEPEGAAAPLVTAVPAGAPAAPAAAPMSERAPNSYFSQPTAPADPTPEAPAGADNPAIEQQARLMGWRPPSEWTGDPAKAKSAADFVKVAEENPNVMNERLSRMQRQLADMAKKNARDAREAEMRGYETAVHQYRAAIVNASDAGDTERVAALTAEMARVPQPLPEPEINPDQLPAYQHFAAQEGWYNKDPVLTGYANQTLAPQLARMGYDTTSPDFFQAVSNGVRDAYPHKFSNPRASQPSPVHGGQPAGGQGAANDYRSLPADAKAACDSYVTRGLLTREAYVQSYFGDE